MTPNTLSRADGSSVSMAASLICLSFGDRTIDWLARRDHGRGCESTSPWDLLEIDRTLITPARPGRQRRTGGDGIALAHSLGIRTAAEGVETMDQLHQLRDLGCDIVKGYLVDRRLPAGEALVDVEGVSDRGRPGPISVGLTPA